MGKTSNFLIDRGTKYERKTNKDETKSILDEINQAITRNDGELLYTHEVSFGISAVLLVPNSRNIPHKIHELYMRRVVSGISSNRRTKDSHKG